MRCRRAKGPSLYVAFVCLLAVPVLYFTIYNWLSLKSQSKANSRIVSKHVSTYGQVRFNNERDKRFSAAGLNKGATTTSKTSETVNPETSDRWIIVDAVNLPLSQIQHVTDVPGWNLLLYGDNVHSLALKRCRHCVYVDDSILVESEFNQFVQHRSVTPFLYAIKHGAKWIYLTRTVYNLPKKVKGYMLTGNSKGMMYIDDRIFDVRSHFGVSENRTVRPAYWLGKWITPSVQAKWEPNLELRKSSLYDITKVERLPHAFVPIKRLLPLNTKGLLVGYESFWSLVGLLTFHEGNSESWRLWRQWLFKDLRTVIAVLPSSGPEPKNLFSNDFKDIGWTKYIPIDNFVCDIDSSSYTCAVTMMTELTKHHIFTKVDLDLVKNWFDWLTKHGLKAPKRRMSLSRDFKEAKPDHLHTVFFEPDSSLFSPNLTDPFRGICHHRPRYKSNKVAKLADVVLIVMFNFPHYYANIATLNYIFRKEFTNVIFCGRSIGKYIAFKKGYKPHVTFLEVNEVGNGIFVYMCGAYAMDMGYKVAGYLSIGDDTLLNVWNIVKLPRDKVWFQHSIRNGSFEQKKVPSVALKQPFWNPWTNTRVGSKALVRIWHNFEAMMSSDQYKSEISSFLTTLERNFGRSRGAFYEASDIFYVPYRLSQHFSLFSKLFYKGTLYLEIAIPTALLGGEYLENIVRLTGSYVWGDDRPSTVKYYNSNHVFLHALKLSNIWKKSDEQNMYCERYLPYIDGKK